MIGILTRYLYRRQNRPDINPFRSPGDALKEWKRRLKVVDPASQPEEQEEEAAPEKPGN